MCDWLTTSWVVNDVIYWDCWRSSEDSLVQMHWSEWYMQSLDLLQLSLSLSSWIWTSILEDIHAICSFFLSHAWECYSGYSKAYYSYNIWSCCFHSLLWCLWYYFLWLVTIWYLSAFFMKDKKKIAINGGKRIHEENLSHDMCVGIIEVHEEE